MSTMVTERTILSTLISNDFEEALEMYSEPDTFKYIAPAQNRNREEHLRFLESRIVQVNEKQGYHWAVRMNESNEFIGLMNLNYIIGTDMMQVGFQLKRKFWNQGFATELTKKVLAFAANETNLKAIYGVFDKRNVASAKIFVKLGFTFHDSKMFEGEEYPIEIWKYTIND